jgi:hypothetical protein
MTYLRTCRSGGGAMHAPRQGLTSSPTKIHCFPWKHPQNLNFKSFPELVPPSQLQQLETPSFPKFPQLMQSSAILCNHPHCSPPKGVCDQSAHCIGRMSPPQPCLQCPNYHCCHTPQPCVSNMSTLLKRLNELSKVF